MTSSLQSSPETTIGRIIASSGLSDRHALFVWLYAKHGQPAYGNGVQAYLDAGFHTKSRVCAKAAAWRLRQHPKVKAAISAIHRAASASLRQQLMELERERRLLFISSANRYSGRN